MRLRHGEGLAEGVDRTDRISSRKEGFPPKAKQFRTHHIPDCQVLAGELALDRFQRLIVPPKLKIGFNTRAGKPLLVEPMPLSPHTPNRLLQHLKAARRMAASQ